MLAFRSVFVYDWLVFGRRDGDETVEEKSKDVALKTLVVIGAWSGYSLCHRAVREVRGQRG